MWNHHILMLSIYVNRIMFIRTIPYNQDALVELPCPLPEGVLPMKLVQSTLIDHTQ
jgi:hypothetical protein